METGDVTRRAHSLGSVPAIRPPPESASALAVQWSNLRLSPPLPSESYSELRSGGLREMGHLHIGVRVIWARRREHLPTGSSARRPDCETWSVRTVQEASPVLALWSEAAIRMVVERLAFRKPEPVAPVFPDAVRRDGPEVPDSASTVSRIFHRKGEDAVTDPNDRATSTLGRSELRNSATASRRNSSGHFDGRPIPASVLQDDKSWNQVFNKAGQLHPGVADTPRSW
jgi:hypothetical protein